MIPGVPSFVRTFESSPEGDAAIAAETSIFAGRATWQLTLAELVERCVFAAVRNTGFFVIDGARRAIAHRQDTESGEEQTMRDMIQLYASLEADGYLRFALQAAGGGPSCPWILRRADSTILNPTIVPPSVGSLSPSEAIILNAISPRETQETLSRLLSAVDAAMADDIAQHWVCLASQRTKILTFWAVNLGSSTLPDFTAEVVGNALLDASFGYRAQLENT